MVPTDDVLRAQCREAAGLLEFPVPCPATLPETASPVRCRIPAAFAGSDARPKKGCALGEGFILEPPGGPTTNHLIITASRFLEGEDCTGGSIDQVKVQGHVAELINCAEFAGLHANHVLLRWSVNGVSYAVSAHGRTDANRHLVQAIAEDIELLGSDA